MHTTAWQHARRVLRLRQIHLEMLVAAWTDAARTIKIPDDVSFDCGTSVQSGRTSISR